MGVFELTIAPGANVPPPHSHTHNEECIYALEGLIRYSVDGVVRDLAPGQWMHTPKGSVHAFSNPHQGTAKALIVLTPDLGRAILSGCTGSCECRRAARPPEVVGSHGQLRARSWRPDSSSCPTIG
ncbi:cupin domain-containing protein [Cupriavidus basilensis]